MEKRNFDKNISAEVSTTTDIVMPTKQEYENCKKETLSLSEPFFSKVEEIKLYSSAITNMKLYKDINPDHTEKPSPKIKLDAVQTSILDSFATLEPVCQLFYKNDKTEMKFYKVILKNGSTYGLKTQIVSRSEGKRINRIIREYNIGKTLGQISKNVVQIHDMKQKSIDNDKKFRIEILMEFFGESLDKCAARLTDKELVNLVLQLVQTLTLMESLGVAHLDLKPANIVWDSASCMLKLIDFGTSIAFYRSPNLIQEPLNEYAERFSGFTACYAPPEILELRKKANFKNLNPQKIDIFCFGITLLDILLSRYGKSIAVQREDYTSHCKFLKIAKEELEKNGEGNWEELVLSCLDYKPEKRLTFEELKGKVISTLKIEPSMKNESIINASHYKKMALAYTASSDYNAAAWFYEKYLNTLDKVKEKNELIAIYNSLASAYNSLGDYNKALEYCAASESLLSEGMSLDDIQNKLSLFNMYGQIFEHLSDYKKSEYYYKRTLELLNGVKEGSYHAFINANIGLGTVYDKLGRYSEAVKFYNVAEKCAKEFYIEKNIELSTIYKNLGALYDNLSDYRKSIENCLKAESIIKNEYDENFPLLANIYNNIASAYDNLGEFRTAISYYDKGEFIIKRIYGEDYVPLADILTNRGAAYNSLGECIHALEDCKKAESIYKKFSENHPSLASTYNNLGQIYSSMGCHSKAVVYYDQFLKIYEKKGLESNPFYGAGCSNIAISYDYLGNFDKGLEFLKKSEKIFIENFGLDYYFLADVYIGWASILKHKGFYTESIEYYTKAEKICKKTTGETHPSLSEVYDGLGSLYVILGDYQKASKYCSDAEILIQEMYGEMHPYFISVYTTIASIKNNLGEYALALEYCKKAISICIKRHGENCTHIASIQTICGSIYENLGNYKEALCSYNKAKTILCNEFGEDNPSLVSVYYNLGSLYNKNDNFATAIDCCKNALKIAQQFLGEKHSSLSIIYCHLGDAYNSLGDFQTALKFFTEAETVMKSVFSDSHPLYFTLYRGISKSYSGLKDVQKENEYKKKTDHKKK